MGILKTIREKKEVKRKAKVEAEKIFMKLNPKMADKSGNFPKVNGNNATTKYGKEARRVEKQVVKTRMAQYKNK